MESSSEQTNRCRFDVAFQRSNLDDYGKANQNFTAFVSNPLISNLKLSQDIFDVVNQYSLEKRHKLSLDPNKSKAEFLNKASEQNITDLSNIGLLSNEKQKILLQGTKPLPTSSIPSDFFTEYVMEHLDQSKSPSLLHQNQILDKEEATLIKQSKKIYKLKNSSQREKQEFQGSPDSFELQKKKKNKKDYWTQKEDSELLSLLDCFGKKWTKIGSIIGGRTGKQVRDRYLNKLRPNIKKDDWTKEEDEKFFALYEKFGNKWCQIAEFLPGRTENQVKNRFYSKIIKTIKPKSKGTLKTKIIEDCSSTEESPVIEIQSYEEGYKTFENLFSSYKNPDFIDPQDFLCRWNDPIENNKGNLDRNSKKVNEYLESIIHFPVNKLVEECPIDLFQFNK